MRNQRGNRNRDRNRRKEILEEEKSFSFGKFLLGLIIVLIVVLGIFANIKIFSGTTKRTNVKYLEEATLKIESETLTEFKWKISYYLDAVKVEKEGVAKKNFIIFATDKIDDEKVIFIRTLNGIEVKYDNKEIEEIEGKYVKNPEYLDIEKYTDIFKTEKMRNELEEKLGKDFEKFKETVFGVLFEDYDYELDGNVYEVTLAAQKRSAIIIICDEKFYIEYYQDGNSNYYTNDDEYKTIKPNKIKLWLEQKNVNSK